MLRWNLRSQRMSRQHNNRHIVCCQQKSTSPAPDSVPDRAARSVRLNKKKKSTNISPYPDEAIERLARAFYPAILACWNSEEGQREFAAWQAEQAHIATKEKQEVPVGELPALLIVCGFLQGASGRAHPVFAFSPLIRDFQPHFSDTPLAHRSKLALHTPAGHCR